LPKKTPIGRADATTPPADPVEGLRARIDALESAVRARDDFLAIAAHELRSPLNALALRLTWLERLAARDANPLLEEIRRTRADADRYSRRAIVLLDVARLNAGDHGVARTTVGIRRLVKDVVEAHRGEASLRGTTIEAQVTTDEAGQWDEHMVEQILSNLVHNALKYGESSPVRMRASVEGGQARFEVEDEGPGIPEAHRARIFEKFERLVDGSAPRSGYGLGLWIVRSMVEAHGGRIDVQPGRARGSLFTVSLPLTG
jgi:signal transduction histidine kinase